MARRSVRVSVKRRGGYRRRYFRRRKFYGKRRAASQQKQRAHFIVKSTYSGYIRIDPISSYVVGNREEYQSSNVGGTAALSICRNLIKSNYFNNIRIMYDQVRINSCKITIVPTQSVLATGVKQAIFVSAWDRNGVDQSQHPPSFSEIASHSSAFQKPLNLESTAWKATRKISVSTLAEKSAWIPTGALAGQTVGDSGFFASQGQILGMPWNPQLLIGILVSPTSANSLGTSQTWGYVAQFEWSLTFRGLRYDIANDDGAVQQVQAVVNPVAAPSVGNTAVAFGNPELAADVAQQGTQIPMSLFTPVRDTVYTSYFVTNWSISSPFTVIPPTNYVTVEGTTATVPNTNNQPDAWTTIVVYAYGEYVVGDKTFRYQAVVGYNLQANQSFTFRIPNAQSVHYAVIFTSENVAYNIGFQLSYSIFTNPASLYNKAEVLSVNPRAQGRLFDKLYGPVFIELDPAD